MILLSVLAKCQVKKMLLAMGKSEISLQWMIHTMCFEILKHLL